MIANINLPFVDLIASATAQDPIALQRSLTLCRVPASPVLPPGKSVDAILGLLVRVDSRFPIYDFAFALRLARRNCTGSPESGEHLEAQGWAINGGRLMIGTEDAETLCDRMEWFNFPRSAYPIGYLDDGLEVAIPSIPAGRVFDFHFVVAYNGVDRGDDSEWFAVDIPHKSLAEAVPASAVKWS
jgi:hypothetical protein